MTSFLPNLVLKGRSLKVWEGLEDDSGRSRTKEARWRRIWKVNN